VAATKPLFAWDCLEDSPSLKTIREPLASLPDVSRFLVVLGKEPQRLELRRIFAALVQKLGVAVPDLGRDTAGGPAPRQRHLGQLRLGPIQEALRDKPTA
jgi:hypothetical protein